MTISIKPDALAILRRFDPLEVDRRELRGEASGKPEPVSEDPDDDKFLAGAIASGSRLIVSGDRHLLRVSGYGGIEVMRPRSFVDEHLG